MRCHDFDSGNVWRLVLALSIPTCLSQAVNVLYAIVDRMFIGNMDAVGDIALAGVGVAVPITSLLSSFAVLIGMGGSPLMAMREGHGEHEEAVRILSTGFSCLLVLSAVLTPLFLIVKTPLLLLFGSSPTTLPYADEYLTWYLLGTPFALVGSGMNSFVINQGMSRRAMVSVMTGALVNVMLDPLFIYVLDMGVRGAAVATVASQAASCAITLTALLSDKATIRLVPAAPRAYIVRRMVRLGLSPFIIIATDSIIMIALNAILQHYGGQTMGDTLVGASTIIQSFHLLVMNPLGGITAGSQGLLSYSYGAGNVARVRRTWACVQVLATIYTALMMALAWNFSAPFIALFTQDGQVARVSMHYLRVFTAAIIPLSLQYNTVDTFTALGWSQVSLPLSLLRKAVFTLALFIIPALTGSGGAAFCAEPVADLTAAVVSTTTLAIMLPRVLRMRAEGRLSI